MGFLHQPQFKKMTYTPVFFEIMRHHYIYVMAVISEKKGKRGHEKILTIVS